MSEPTEADFMIVKLGDGESPGVFTAICGIENVSINKAVNANDRYRRDCAKPGIPGARKNRATGKSLTITASGAANVDNIETFEDILGIKRNYQIGLYQTDGSDAGVLLGTYAGAFMLMSDNMTADPNGDSTGEITLNNDGPWTWTKAA